MLTNYHFEELPLATEGDWTGTYADGEADIECFRDGRWRVAAIKLRVGKHDPGRTPVYKTIPAPKPLAQIIELTLLSHPYWQTSVQERVDEALRTDGARVEELEDYRIKRRYAAQVEV